MVFSYLPPRPLDVFFSQISFLAIIFTPLAPPCVTLLRQCILSGGRPPPSFFVNLICCSRVVSQMSLPRMVHPLDYSVGLTPSSVNLVLELFCSDIFSTFGLFFFFFFFLGCPPPRDHLVARSYHFPQNKAGPLFPS